MPRRIKQTEPTNGHATLPAISAPEVRSPLVGSGTNKPGRRAVPVNGRVSRVGRVGRVFLGYRGPVGSLVKFLARYVVLPETSLLVLATWTVASYLIEVYDRFPHVAITSPEKRCGKSLLLELLSQVVLKPHLTTNISPAAIYRLVEQERPTLLMDESQSLSRRGSEASEVIRELLNAGISKHAKVIRCGGEGRDQVEHFSVYSPKIFAMIGAPDAVLSDRSLPVPLKRKTKDDVVERYRSRVVEEEANKLRTEIEEWTMANCEQVEKVYDSLEPFDIENDRMADLLLPLQAVLSVAGGGRPLNLLRKYAIELDERDREQEAQSPGVRLLLACREIFVGHSFISTDNLILKLCQRLEEPWQRWNNRGNITREAVANLLRPYKIKSQRNKEHTTRGYFKDDFSDAWGRYLPPLKIPPDSADSAYPPVRAGAATPLKNPADPAIPADPAVGAALPAALKTARAKT